MPSEPTAPVPPPYEYTAPPATTPPPPPLPPEPAPLGRLPSDVSPIRAALFLQVDPAEERFAGTIELLVDLKQPRDVIWLHGKGIHARTASVRIEGSAAVSAAYGEVDNAGVAALRLAQPIGPGRAVIRIDYDAPFFRTAEGLYVVAREGKKYAFTQLEAIAARTMMPCFDEPAFKIPYDVTLFVPKGLHAIANSREIERSDAEAGLTRITFATTPPLPSYLLALAVGPFDIFTPKPLPPNAVRKRALALRGVSVAGRGPQMAFALEHAGELISGLEGYFGVECPYEKIDIIAVPDRNGAMENPGALTFTESSVLFDEATAPLAQKQGYYRLMMHELSHLWLGDLVTMPWWDDLWLKEGFATWASARLLPQMRPSDGLELFGLRSAQGAMEMDSLLSARKVRQEVRTSHDIENAFDDITYQKGAAIAGMMERWIGKDAFRAGLSSYLASHQHGSAAADDLFAALTASAGRDVSGPLRSFVSQPGVPLVEAEVRCGAGTSYLALRQSRHLPLGSAGDPARSWQIPVCAKIHEGKATEEVCTLLTGPEGALPLPLAKCPSWVMPNAGAAGYYVFSMPPGDMKKLTTSAWKDLSPAERLSVAHALKSSLKRGAKVPDVLPLLLPLATEPDREIVQAVVEPFRTAKAWLSAPAEREAVEKSAQQAFKAAWKNVGWEPKKGQVETDERRGLRADLFLVMALLARDPEVRKGAASRGKAYLGFGKDGALHPEAAPADLLTTCLIAAAEDGDAAFFDHVLRHLERATDDVVRGRLIAALGAFREPKLAARALDLTFDPRIPPPFLTAMVRVQLAAPETQEDAWKWLTAHVDRLASRLPSRRAGSLPWLGASLCDRAHADALSTLFSERVEKYAGGPRNLAGALESIHLCTARRAVLEPGFRTVFKIAPPKAPPAVAPPSAPNKK